LLIFFLASLVGIPFTGGFFGKLVSFQTALGGGAVWLVIIGLLNSGLAAAYYLRLALVSAQAPKEGKSSAAAPRVGVAVGAALLFAVAATMLLGVYPNRVLGAAEAGAHTLQAPPGESGSPVNAVAP
jgi:NADH-quinone oxidoreductase subunit N